MRLADEAVIAMTDDDARYAGEVVASHARAARRAALADDSSPSPSRSRASTLRACREAADERAHRAAPALDVHRRAGGAARRGLCGRREPRHRAGRLRRQAQGAHRLAARRLDETHGRRFDVARVYTLSLHERAALRKDLESWRGRKFTEMELDGFDLEKLLGVNAQVAVTHDLGDDGTIYANVSTVVPPREGRRRSSRRSTTCAPRTGRRRANGAVRRRTRRWTMMSPSKAATSRAPTAAASRFYDITHTDGTTARYPSVTTILGAIAKPALSRLGREGGAPGRHRGRRRPLRRDRAPARTSSRARPTCSTLEQRLGKTKAHVKALAKAAEIGSAAHAKIEWTLQARPRAPRRPRAAVADAAQWAVMAFEDWREAVALEPLLVEQTVWSREHAYAGTLDLLARLDTRALLRGARAAGAGRAGRSPTGSGRATTATAVIDFKTGKAIYAESHLQSVRLQARAAGDGPRARRWRADRAAAEGDDRPRVRGRGRAARAQAVPDVPRCARAVGVDLRGGTALSGSGEKSAVA